MKIYKSVIFWLLVANITGQTALAEHENLRHLAPCSFTSYVVNSVCVPCPWWLGEIGTPDKKSCTHCPAGQVLNAAKTACVPAVGACNFISHVENSACTPCQWWEGEIATLNKTGCTHCPVGQVLNRAKTACVSAVGVCNFISHVENSACTPCQWWEGEIATPNKTGCTHCPLGQVLNRAKTACVSAVGVCNFISHVENSACTPCQWWEGEIATPNKTGCTHCPAGQVLNAAKTACVPAVGACNFISHVENSACTPCQWWEGEIATPNKMTCTHCPAGQVLNAAKTACISAVGVCDFTSHAENSACMPCQWWEGMIGTPDKKGCTQCPDGTILDDAKASCVSAVINTSQVQWNLAGMGYLTYSDINGKNGPATQNAVKKFQADRCIKVDGFVGTATRVALVNLMKQVQAKAGATQKDGFNGPQTRAKIIMYQKQHGLVANGIAGATTFAKMGLVRKATC